MAMKREETFHVPTEDGDEESEEKINEIIFYKKVKSKKMII
jgi:hypothetical protein